MQISKLYEKAISSHKQSANNPAMFDAFLEYLKLITANLHTLKDNKELILLLKAELEGKSFDAYFTDNIKHINNKTLIGAKIQILEEALKNPKKYVVDFFNEAYDEEDKIERFIDFSFNNALESAKKALSPLKNSHNNPIIKEYYKTRMTMLNFVKKSYQAILDEHSKNLVIKKA